MIACAGGCINSCGIQTAWTELSDVRAAVASVAIKLDHAPIGFLMVFFSPAYETHDFAAALNESFSGIAAVGCSTSGGISPVGAIDRGLLLIAFPRRGFRIVTSVLTAIDHIDVATAASTIRAMHHGLDRQPGGNPLGQRFVVSLIDALANAEELVVAAVGLALDGIPLIGGSAGDDLAFHGTVLLYEGAIHANAAVLILVETDFPVRTFKSDSFKPTTQRFVVTAANEAQRRVYELNAEPAAVEYAMAVGLDPAHLTPLSFASHPLAVKIGGEFHCRSISRVAEDGSLIFFCAIGEGAVLTLTQPLDLVASMQAELSSLAVQLGGIDLVIGFNCVLRRLDAESRQVRSHIADLYRRYNVVGFETYGEQFHSMHLNQTFAGIAFGKGNQHPLT